jgi:hypothetical protein
LAVAEAGDIVFVAAEVLLLCGPVVVRFARWRRRKKTLLQFEGAELLVYDLPDNLVGGHSGQSEVFSIDLGGRSSDYFGVLLLAVWNFFKFDFFLLVWQNFDRR